MTDDQPNSLEGAGGRWLEDTDVPSFFVPASGGLGVVVFLRAGEFDEPLPLTGPLAVVASFYPLAEVVSRVGGDRAAAADVLKALP